MKKKINILWYFLFMFLLFEVLYKEATFHTLFSLNTVFIIPFTLFYVSFLSFIFGLFKNVKVKKIITFVITIFLSIYYAAQFVYYHFYSSLISLYSLGMGTVQVFGWFDQILLVIFRNIIPFMLFFLPLVLLIIYNRRIDFDKHEMWRTKIYFITTVISLLLCVISLMPNEKDVYSNNNLFFNIHYPTLTVNRFGLFTTGLLDAYRYISKFSENYVLDINYNSSIYTKDEYNVLDIDFASIMDNGFSDEKIISMYLSNIEPTKKNEYTSLFKGKNLIFINAESFDTLAIDKDITPTLYKMNNEGFKFNNYYVPLFPVSTSDGEYMNSTSLIPKEGVWSIYETSKNYMMYSIPNVFNKLGYNSYAFHNHTYNFYHRDEIYPNLGFKKYLACGNGLEKKINCENWPESDEEMFKETLNYYINDEKFVAYFMTVSGHLRYTKNNDMAKKNWKYVENIKGDENYKAYLAQNKELDNGIEYIINELNKKGKLNDTVFVIMPDHYPYGFSDKELSKLDKDRDGIFNKFKSSFIIWTPNIKSTSVNKITSSIDVLPTIYNLFGIEYDSRLLIGKDAFSDSEGIFITSNRSFKTNTLEYDALNDKYKFFGKKDLSLLNKYKNEVYSKFTISSKILENDYYKKVQNSLD